MKPLITVALAILLSAGPAFAGGDHRDDEDDAHNSSACERTAGKMFSSCRFEANEEFSASIGACLNFGDRKARRACREVARDERHEARGECGEVREAREDLCELLGEDRYDPEAFLMSDNFVEDPDASNPYFSLEPGHTYVARAGEDFEETIVVTVTDEVIDVLGVNCRVVVDIVFVEEDGELEPVEITDDFYALAKHTNDVYYCGEIARNFEDGLLTDLDGSFLAGRDGAKSGILIKGLPLSGDSHRQEWLLGEAEDAILYLNGADSPTSVGGGEGGKNPAFPCFGECVKTEEFIPPEPDSGEFKYFIANIGFVLGVALEDGEPSGERDELLCVGSSLDVLNDSACGLDDPAALRQQLCELSPDAFCD